MVLGVIGTSFVASTSFACLQLGLGFPRAGTDAATQAVVDLSLYEETELSAVQDGNRFPLIIRLETVTEKGLSEGHSLSVLFCG